MNLGLLLTLMNLFLIDFLLVLLIFKIKKTF